MELNKKRWYILAASCFVNLCIGSLYAWSVFATPLATHLSQLSGTQVTNIAIAFTLANAVGPITMISGGFINDKIGPKWVLLVGGILFGGGMIGTGLATSLVGVLIFYGLGVGLGVGMVYGTIVSNTIKFFPDRKGFVGGLTTAFYGGSSILIPPLANELMQKFHITVAFRILGVAMLLIICLSAFVIMPCPKGFCPNGWKLSNQSGSGTVRDKNYKQMLCDPIFYIMVVTLMCGAFSGLMIISQASPLAQRMLGMSSSAAALVVSVLALFNTFGRIIAGLVSDKIGVPNTLTVTFIGSIAALLLLWQCGSSSSTLFYIGVSVVGFCFGAIMGVYPSFTAMQFGTKNNSVNYGIMFIGFASAGTLGPVAIGKIYDLAGRYQPAFLISAVLATVGLLLIQVYKTVSRKELQKCKQSGTTQS